VTLYAHPSQVYVFLVKTLTNPVSGPDFVSVGSVRVRIAGGAGSRTRIRWRKVRAPQGRVPGNARAPQGDGKCHREQTADGSFGSTGKGERVR